MAASATAPLISPRDDAPARERRIGRAPTAGERALIAATLPFSRASWAAGIWQTASTLALIAASFFLLLGGGPGWARWAVVPVLGLLLVRAFILQHDAGHLSLVPSRAGNLGVGHVMSVLTGIPFEPFRTEHAWHHKIQGRLDLRGLDHFDPITDEEARRDPRAGRRRGRPIPTLLANVDSLLIRRRFRGAYYMYRRAPGARPPNHHAITASLWFTGTTSVAVHAAVMAIGGLGAWLGFLLALLVSVIVGTTLMWVQHNFETVLHCERPAEWSFVRIALEGTSYLRLPQPLAWFTGDAGVHHVHHLNPAIPNYRLEAARRAVPELAAVAPLSFRDVVRCFTHAIWSVRERRMVTFASVAPGGAPRA
jgi:omega-6 fatty acid desaturase (delta-12 desaturase)